MSSQVKDRVSAPSKCHIDGYICHGSRWLKNRRMHFQVMIDIFLPAIFAGYYLLICATPPAIRICSLLAASITSRIATALLIVSSTRMLATGI
jgi:hypothetical protein